MLEAQIFHSLSENQTAEFASRMAQNLKVGDIICLHGTLGMGKSVFARALIRALCHDDNLEVPSPTFTLVQTYDTPDALLWHFDLYRLEEPDEIYEIGWEEALEGGIVLIEWPERLGSLTPARRIDITLAPEDNGNTTTARIITIDPQGDTI